jgi:hypothetical protein
MSARSAPRKRASSLDTLAPGVRVTREKEMSMRAVFEDGFYCLD